MRDLRKKTISIGLITLLTFLITLSFSYANPSVATVSKMEYFFERSIEFNDLYVDITFDIDVAQNISESNQFNVITAQDELLILVNGVKPVGGTIQWAVGGNNKKTRLFVLKSYWLNGQENRISVMSGFKSQNGTYVGKTVSFVSTTATEAWILSNSTFEISNVQGFTERPVNNDYYIDVYSDSDVAVNISSQNKFETIGANHKVLINGDVPIGGLIEWAADSNNKKIRIFVPKNYWTTNQTNVISFYSGFYTQNGSVLSVSKSFSSTTSAGGWDLVNSKVSILSVQYIGYRVANNDFMIDVLFDGSVGNRLAFLYKFNQNNLMNFSGVSLRNAIMQYSADDNLNKIRLFIPTSIFQNSSVQSIDFRTGFIFQNGKQIETRTKYESPIIITSARGYNIVTFNKNNDIVNTDNTKSSIVSKDALGRTTSEISGVKDTNFLGVFYFTWLGQHSELFTDIYDISKLQAQSPANLWDYSNGGPANSPNIEFHFWGEPLYGYYNSADPWIIRRHIELLTMAGVDFIALDATNGLTYDPVWQIMLPILDEYIEQGWKVPKIMFYTHTNGTTIDGKAVIERLYNELYKADYYPRTWFMWNGKPLITAFPTVQASLSPELQNYFSFKSSWLPYQSTQEYPNIMPWMDWKFPQTNFESVMSVSVAQHPGYPFSRSAYFNNIPSIYNSNRGRGFDFATSVNGGVDAIREGKNFESQWSTALTESPQMVFVTGWNEWVAQKYYDEKYNIASFVDTVSEEFSRDVEMMKGGYGDNFYLQLMRNAREYKKTSNSKIISNRKTLSLDVSNIGQWTNAGRIYEDFAGDALSRDYDGAAKTVHYNDNSNRNDIVKTRVVNDDTNLYISIETKENNVIDFSNTKWMNILLNVNGSTTDNRWEGYNYIVNRYPATNGTTSLEKANSNITFSFTKTANLQLSVAGRYIMVKIPLARLGINDSSDFTIDFKVSDNVTNQGDIMDYYVSGDSAPIGRMNYRYNAGVGDVTALPAPIINFGMYDVSNTNIVTGVSPNTTVAMFKSQLTLQSGASVTFDRSNESLVGTNTQFSLINGNSTVVYKIVINGDLDGNGLIEIVDLALLKNHILKIQILPGEYYYAGDIFDRGVISIKDLIAIKKHVLGLFLII